MFGGYASHQEAGPQAGRWHAGRRCVEGRPCKMNQSPISALISPYVQPRFFHDSAVILPFFPLQ